jgi:hypothetical protein
MRSLTLRKSDKVKVRALRSLANMTTSEAAKHALLPSLVRTFCYLSALPPYTEEWRRHADLFYATTDEILATIPVEGAN